MEGSPQPTPGARPTEPTLAETVRALANQPVGDSWVERKRRSFLLWAERVTTSGPFAAPAELGWSVYRRLLRSGSSALPALFAYRIFAFLLPLTLVGVLVLGVASTELEIDKNDAVERLGLVGYFASSVSAAAPTESTTGVIAAIVIGLGFVLYQSYALLKGLRAIHALVWGQPITSMRRPLVVSVSALVGLAAFLALGGLLRSLRDDAPWWGSVAIAALLLGIGPLFWLLLSLWLPNRASHWTGLVPGALLVGAFQLLFTAAVGIFLVDYLEGKKETYGVLGVAAGILFGLYAQGWVIATAAALNAELEARRPAPDMAGV